MRLFSPVDDSTTATFLQARLGAALPGSAPSQAPWHPEAQLPQPSPGPLGHTSAHVVSLPLWFLSHLQRDHAICLVSRHPRLVSPVFQTTSTTSAPLATHMVGLSLFLEEVQDCGLEWQGVRFPCGRTGTEPGSLASDLALPFFIKHDLCLNG